MNLISVSDVYYAKDLTDNLLSYCKLAENEVVLIYEGERCYIKCINDGSRVFEVEKKKNVLVVCKQSGEAAAKCKEAVYAALHTTDTNHEPSVTVKCTPLDLHKRLNDLIYG